MPVRRKGSAPEWRPLADLVKTTLGPKGMDKILQKTGRGRQLTVTNDGATILKSLHIDNPAAKVLVDISKVQDDEVGDGTTSVVVLAGELLREAEKLVNSKIHPMTITSGYRMAADAARNALLPVLLKARPGIRACGEQPVALNVFGRATVWFALLATSSSSQQHPSPPSDILLLPATSSSSQRSPRSALLSRVSPSSPGQPPFPEKFRSDLMKIAMTTLSSKILSQDREHFAKLAVDAIIKKPGGSLKDSFLDEGFILDKKIGIGQPKRIEDAKILVANTAMEGVHVDSMSKVAEIEAAEKQKMREKVQKIIGHGINCFINRQLIYNFPEELFDDAGILAIENADFDGIERLALVTGGEIAATFDNPESV
ncbi:hypothetical protein MLD38_022170 [Melastoma candidum]|uniref:Uncharacterized protein n=1 Tax=Melastoma candidum TaxID=119954 RepID=A0ACB9QLT7_9MYRT|nr:hypothetical protein MLD38_022170 [Melastoma candidum]